MLRSLAVLVLGALAAGIKDKAWDVSPGAAAGVVSPAVDAVDFSGSVGEFLVMLLEKSRGPMQGKSLILMLL